MTDCLINGDCAEKMRDLAPNSIDAIVTDPPYGLAFMGANWDYGVPGEMFWREALRVAKPGAHLLAFGGTRTYHRLACAIEDAGWEVRDCIMWVYGSGFPKSMDVSKAIDKHLRRDYVQAAVDLGMQIPGNSLHDWTKAEHSPSDKWWEEFKRFIPQQDWLKIERHVIGTKTKARGVGCGVGIPTMGADIQYNTFDITEPCSSMAKQWQGWGTCLKPAVEPIVVARKPLEGTVAANCLKYGTGAINIDACRVGADGGTRAVNFHGEVGNVYGNGSHPKNDKQGIEKGRFPANLIHDGSDEVLAMFPDTGKSGVAVRHNSGGCNFGGKSKKPLMYDMSYSDSGSAARFFYCAKASRSERGEGNIHPTVKPLALMRYLVRLVTRKGGIVLDPFMGSGTTGVAAIQEGANFIGIERDPHYYEIASRRVNDAKPIPPTTTQEELSL